MSIPPGQLSTSLLFCFLCLIAAGQASAKTDWYQASNASFIVYSNASQRQVSEVLVELDDARAILNTLMPDLVTHDSQPLRVVVCRGGGTMRRFSMLYEGKPRDVAGFFTRDSEGALMAIRTDFDDTFGKHVIFHEYVHHLTRNHTKHLPLWLTEGIAELFATTRRLSEDRVVAGEFLKYNLARLDYQGLMPFETLFSITTASPEYNSDKHGAGLFYAQSWIFLHYLVFGKNDIAESVSSEFLTAVFNGRSIDERFLIETLGMNYDELGKKILGYARGGRFSKSVFKLEEQASSRDIEFQSMSEAEFNLLQGKVLLSTRGADHALPLIQQALSEMPNNALAHAYLGYCSLAQGDKEPALSALQKSTSLVGHTPYTKLNYAETILRSITDRNGWLEDTLSQEETLQILRLLFQAKQEAGNFDRRLYHAIGETWLSSKVDPQEKHVDVMADGINAFPTDKWIGLYSAILYNKVGNREKAIQIVEHYYRGNLTPQQKAQFESLAEALELEGAASGSS